MYLPEIQVLPTGVQVADHKAQALQYLVASEKKSKQTSDFKGKYYKKSAEVQMGINSRRFLIYLLDFTQVT